MKDSDLQPKPRHTPYCKYHRDPRRSFHHVLALIVVGVLVTTAVVSIISDISTEDMSFSIFPVTIQQASTLESLTNELLVTVGEYSIATGSEREMLLAKATRIAEERKALLLAEITIFDSTDILEDETQHASAITAQGLPKPNLSPLLSILPASVAAQMPSEIQAFLEIEEEIEGTVEVFHVDGIDGMGPQHEKVHEKKSQFLYNLTDTNGKKVAVYFGEKAPALTTGDHVRIKGVRIDDTFAALGESQVSLLGSTPTVLANTTGQLKTLVILVNFSDAPSSQPFTQAEAQTAMKTTSDFDFENSYGQTSLLATTPVGNAADVTGWHTIPLQSSVCDYAAIRTYAKQEATKAGYSLSNYSRFVYAFPQNTCSWWGMGMVGGTPSDSWIHAKWGFTLPVIGHEMGHNFGLYHSRALPCDGQTCSDWEYGDGFDIMGRGSAHFNAFQKERLGWLNYRISPPLQTVTESGAYTLSPYETADGSVKGFKVLKDSLTNTYYYLEYRAGLGFDGSVAKAVILHTARPTSPSSVSLVELDQSSASDWILDVGQTYSDPLAGLTFTTISEGASGATVEVAFGTPACTQRSPLVTITPGSQSGQGSGNATYSVSVENTNSASCEPAMIALSSILPIGWNGVFSPNSATLQSGATATTSLVVSPLSGTGDGSYPFTVKGTWNGLEGSAGATYIVYSADITAPVVQIAQPLDGAILTGQSYTLSATASDNVGVKKVEFYLDDALIGSDTSAPYSYRFQHRKITGGSHTITAKAYDARGNSGTASVSVMK